MASPAIKSENNNNNNNNINDNNNIDDVNIKKKKNNNNGRRKIEIKPIQHPANRRATFEKRRIGLVKKAMELSILCSSTVSVTIYTPLGDVYLYSSEPFENVIHKFQKYTGPYRLLTNDHLDQMVPGKASSSSVGYEILKQQSNNNNNTNNQTTATTHQNQSAYQTMHRPSTLLMQQSMHPQSMQRSMQQTSLMNVNNNPSIMHRQSIPQAHTHASIPATMPMTPMASAMLNNPLSSLINDISTQQSQMQAQMQTQMQRVPFSPHMTHAQVNNVPNHSQFAISSNHIKQSNSEESLIQSTLTDTNTITHTADTSTDSENQKNSNHLTGKKRSFENAIMGMNSNENGISSKRLFQGMFDSPFMNSIPATDSIDLSAYLKNELIMPSTESMEFIQAHNDQSQKLFQ